MEQDKNITGRSSARRAQRAARNNRKEEANLSQVLRMTPNRDRRETLASALVLQRARAAAERKDREAAIAAERTNHGRQLHRVAPNYDATELKFRTKPPVEWTPAEGEVECDTDADEEESYDEEEEEYKTNEDEPDEKHDEDAAAKAAAEDADSSLIKTPADERNLTPTQSDLDFIATDDDNEEMYAEDDDADYYPSTAEDNDEEEEELLSELLQSGNLTQQQSTRVKTRLRTLQRARVIALSLIHI